MGWQADFVYHGSLVARSSAQPLSATGKPVANPLHSNANAEAPIVRFNMRTGSWLVSAWLAVSLTSPVGAQASFCDGPESPLKPSRDLYCIELVPAVGVRAGGGRVELGRTPGPFTVDVTADGHLRYTPTLTLGGLDSAMKELNK